MGLMLDKLKTSNMKIRNILKACIIIPAAAAILASCKEKEYTPYYNAYLTAIKAGEETGGCNFISDDSITVVPLNMYDAISKLKTDDRVLATFSIPSGEITDPVEVELTSILKLTPMDIIATASPDTLSYDPVDPLSMWHSGGIKGISRFLTISYAIQTSNNNIPHEICLVDDLTVTNPDQEGYYHLRFSHNANNDPSIYATTTVATFLLPDKYTSAQVKGIKVHFKPFSAGVDSTMTVNFK